MRKFMAIALIAMLGYANIAYAKEAQMQKEIIESVKTYLSGITEGKSAKMKPVFVKEATIFGAKAGQKVSGGQIQILYDVIDSLGEAQQAKSDIEILYQFENIAAVKVDTKNLHNANVIDLLLLTKIDNEWRITSKLWQEY